jgi:hypothetical protein
MTIIVIGCAKIGYPSGGPTDKTPPKVVESKPPMNSTRFIGKKVEITFDEFVQLVDLSKQFVVSPPMKKRPTPRLRSKNVVVDFEDGLKDSTTYRLYFGNSIVDVNAGNPLKNFEFIFSTGDVIDSLSLRGRVVKAFDHIPDKDGVYVMLYDKFQDSIPRKQLPVYITKTDEKGWFSITHIKPGKYMIFALKDLNQNLLFDLPNEEIAFSDTLFHLDNRYFMPDSLIKADTTSVDTANWAPFKSQVQLMLFAESHEKQYLKKYERTSPEIISLIFNTPVSDSLKIEPLNFKKQNWLIPDYKLKNDTMMYWITDTSLVFKDTLKLRIGFTVMDSLERPFIKYDTIALAFKKPPVTKNKKATKIGISKFKIGSNTESQPMIDLNSRVMLKPTHPLAGFDISKLQLTKTQDEKKTRIKFTIEHDTSFLRLYYLNFKLESQTEYEFIADSMAFKDIYNHLSDSTGIHFRSQRDDYYGRILLQMDNVKEQMIIQVYDDKGELVQQKVIDHDQKVVFDFLVPGEYKLKAIYDKNRNKLWDTGNFAKKLQPEKVLFYPKKIPLRSNFDIEETWKLE